MHGLGRATASRVKDPILAARASSLRFARTVLARSQVRVQSSLTSSGDKQWLKLLVETLTDEDLSDLGLCRIDQSPPLPPAPRSEPRPSPFSTLTPSFPSKAPIAVSLALAAIPAASEDAASDATFVENVTISTLLIEEPEQRYFYTRLRNSRLQLLIEETGSLGIVASPTAEAVMGSTASLEPGMLYYLKPTTSRGLQPASPSADSERTLANAPRVLAAALDRVSKASAADSADSASASSSVSEAEEDAHDEALWLAPSDAVLARARYDFPDARALGERLSVPGIKGEPPVTVDCAVVSDGAAWVVVAAEALTEQSGESVLEAVSNIAYWRDRDSCPEELRVFRGKRLVPVLCGKAIRPLRSVQTKVTPEVLGECWASIGVALIVPRSVSRRLGDAFQRKAAALFSR